MTRAGRTISNLYAVYGASGCGRGVMPLARKQLAVHGSPKDQLVFIDDGLVQAGVFEVNGHRVMSYQTFLEQDVESRYVVLAVANSAIRARLAARCDHDSVLPWTVSSDNTIIMDNVDIGVGAVLSPFVTLTSNIKIGRYFHANLYSYVEHDCVIGDYVTFAPGVKCNGNITIHDHAYIGAGAIIRQGQNHNPLIIGEGAVIGMGAVVTRDVGPGVTVVGNPARVLSKS